MSSLRRKLNELNLRIEAAKASRITLYVSSENTKPPAKAGRTYGSYGMVNTIDYAGFRSNPEKFANYPSYHYIFKVPGVRVLNWEQLRAVVWKNRSMFIKKISSAISRLSKETLQGLATNNEPITVLQQDPIARSLSYYDVVLKHLLTYADLEWLRQFDAVLISHSGLTKHNHPDDFYLFDWALNKIEPKPIDGTLRRFVAEKQPGKQQVPKAVIEALVYYTTKAQRKLDPEARDWLQKNLPKKTKPMRLYRGVSFLQTPVLQEARKQAEKQGKKFEDIYDGMDVISRRWLGLPATEIKIGAKVVLSKKENSFSTLKGVTDMFAEQGNGFVGVVIEAVVKPEQIIADLSDLPASVVKSLTYFAQSEVLVAGPVEGKIIKVLGSDVGRFLTPPKKPRKY